MSRRVPKGVLVIDVGGSNVKALLSGGGDAREMASPAAVERKIKIPTDEQMTAKRIVAQIGKKLGDSKYDAVSIGFPGVVLHDIVMSEP